VNIEKVCVFKSKPVLFLSFEIVEGEHRGIVLRGFCNAAHETFSENTKLYQWYYKITGDALEPGDEADLSPLFNKVLKIQVSDNVSRKTKNKFSNVKDILGVICEL